MYTVQQICKKCKPNKDKKGCESWIEDAKEKRQAKAKTRVHCVHVVILVIWKIEIGIFDKCMAKSKIRILVCHLTQCIMQMWLYNCGNESNNENSSLFRHPKSNRYRFFLTFKYDKCKCYSQFKAGGCVRACVCVCAFFSLAPTIFAYNALSEYLLLVKQTQQLLSPFIVKQFSLLEFRNRTDSF